MPLPRGPRGHLLVGNLPALRRDLLGFLRQSAQTYGDLVPIRYGPRLVLLLSHPDLIEEVLVKRARAFKKSRLAQLLRPVLGDGLFLSEGSFWLRQRRLVQPAFHRARIAAYADVMVAYAERMASAWRGGQEVDAHAEMMRVTQEIVVKTLFDVEAQDGDAMRVGDALLTILEDFSARRRSLVSLPDWVPSPGNVRARRAIATLDAVVLRIVSERRKSSEDRGDLLSMLLAARDVDDGAGMSDQQVRDEVMTLFLAGHETTAVALSWTWFLLAQAPEVEAALHEELERVLGERAPTLADLPRLPTVERILLESMRLYPPAFTTSREVVTPTEVGGHELRPGTNILMSQWVVHHDPRWFPDPDVFRPERWADGLLERLPKYAYFPFGGGPRVCVGTAFANMEAALVLATIARRFRLRLAPNAKVEARPYVTLRPHPGLPMVLEARRAPERHESDRLRST